MPMTPERAMLLIELLREAFCDGSVSTHVAARPSSRTSNAEKCRRRRLRIKAERHQTDTKNDTATPVATPPSQFVSLSLVSNSSSPDSSLSASFSQALPGSAGARGETRHLQVVPTDTAATPVATPATPTPTPPKPTKWAVEIDAVWAHWLSCRGRVIVGHTPVLTEARKKMVRGRLAEGITVERLCAAGTHIWTNAWSLEDPAKRISFEICYRNAAQVERYEVPSTAPLSGRQLQKMPEQTPEWLEETFKRSGVRF